MSCPAMSFSGVTREVFECLGREAASMGFPVPKGASGRVAYHSVEAEYRWEEGEATLEIIITRSPGWLECSMVESRVRQAMRGCGAA